MALEYTRCKIFSGELSVILITVWWWQVRERLVVSKEAMQKFEVERFISGT